MLQGIGKTVSGFIEIMMESAYAPALGSDVTRHAEKKEEKSEKDKARELAGKL